MKLRIILACGSLGKRTASTLYVRDLSLRLAEIGHEPAVFTCLPGDVAAELEAVGVRVITDTDSFAEKPDLIQGHSRWETLMASLRFPRVPVVSLCQGLIPSAERPPVLPSIRRYAAIDFATRDRVARELGVIKEQMPILHNFLDLRRLPLRSQLPEKPSRALAVGEEHIDGSPIPYLREACRRAGIDLEVVSCPSDDLFVNYDLVFAAERLALEALAVGCAVILCDQTGVGNLVTREEIEEMRDWNFGGRLVSDTPMPRAIERQIAAFDASDAAECTRYVRETCSQEAAVDRLVALYREILEEGKHGLPVDARAVAEAAAHELTKIRKELGDQPWTESAVKPQEKQGKKSIASRLGWPRR